MTSISFFSILISLSVEDQLTLGINLLCPETFAVTAADAFSKINMGDQYIVDNVFSYKLETSEISVESSETPVIYVSKVTFKSDSSADGLAWRVGRVDFTVSVDCSSWVGLEAVRFNTESKSLRAMRPSTPSSDDNPGLQIFTATLKYSRFFRNTGFTLHFVVHRVSTVENFRYQLRDSFYAGELWDSAVNKEHTDVEFKVEGKTFPAHRSILAARCPALAALIAPAESSPLSPATVYIEAVDPAAFEALLHFIYTGMIKTPTVDENLLEVAKTFGMETLKLVALASGKREPQIPQHEEEQVPDMAISLE